MCIIIFFFTYWIKKSLVSPQVCNIIFFFSCVSGKNHFWAHKRAISFFFTYLNKITCKTTNIQYQFFFSLVWVEKKITRRFTSVQYHFSSLVMWIKKNHLWVHKRTNHKLVSSSVKRFVILSFNKSLLWSGLKTMT